MERGIFIDNIKVFIKTHPALLAGATLLLGGTAVVEGNAFLHDSPSNPHLINIENRKDTTQTIGIRDSETKRSNASQLGIDFTYIGSLMTIGGAALSELKKKC